MLGRVVFHYHLSYHARAVESVKEFIVLLVLQLVPVMVSLTEVRSPSDQGFGSTSNITNGIIDVKHKLCLVWGGEHSSRDLRSFWERSDWSIEEFATEM